MKILFVTARFPYPPLKGDKSIAYQRLRYFSKQHEITLLSFSDDAGDRKGLGEIARYCRDVHVVPLRRRRAYPNLVLHGLGHVPLQVLYYRSRQFTAKLQGLLAGNHYDLIHAFMLRVAPYLCEYGRCPKIVELIDSMELNMLRRTSLEKGIRGLVFAAEARRLSVYEAAVARRFDRVVVVSSIDARTIGTENIVVNPIGVDLAEFRPRPAAKAEQPLIVFTGNMRYFPNETAVLYFARAILPLICRRLPHVRFRVIGVGPSENVKRLEKMNKAIEVVGFVDSMPDHISRAWVSVCPMLAGSGMQSKILEALACGVPVVATPVARGDIRLAGRHGLFTAERPEEFADSVVGIIEDAGLRAALERRAPQAVRTRYSWERSNSTIEKIYAELSTRDAGERRHERRRVGAGSLGHLQPG